MPAGTIVADDLLIGAHQSIAGGTPRAIERAIATGCRVLQIFVKNNNRWQGKRIAEVEIEEFRQARRAARLAHVVAHASYLINLASASRPLRQKSVAALADEIWRCRDLEIPDLVLHPGSHGGQGESEGVRRIAASVEEAFARTAQTRVRVLLETAAGQGTSVGYRFEHLRDIFSGVRDRGRLGVCLDTCHVHAAGYDLVTPSGYAATIAALANAVGLGNLRVIHVNDSKKPLGSRLDRHEHIGRGSIGNAGFQNLMTDPRLTSVPKVLETPKDPALDFDRANLEALRRLARGRLPASNPGRPGRQGRVRPFPPADQ